MIDNFIPDIPNDSKEIEKSYGDSLTEMDKVAIKRRAGAIEPIIFESGKSIGTPILSSIGFEMIGDSNLEALKNNIFSNDVLTKYQNRTYLVQDLHHPRVEVLAENTTNYIIESSMINFANLCNYLFKDIVENWDQNKCIFSLSDNEIIWIYNQIESYIDNLVDVNREYNVIEDSTNSLINYLRYNKGDMLPDGIWKSYAEEVAVTIAQYIGSIMSRILYSYVYKLSYIDNGRDILKNLRCRSFIIDNIGDVSSMSDSYIIYVYINNYIYPYLYELIANNINGSIYCALCNIIITFPNLFYDIHRKFINKYKNKGE